MVHPEYVSNVQSRLWGERMFRRWADSPSGRDVEDTLWSVMVEHEKSPFLMEHKNSRPELPSWLRAWRS